jgi:hypothetical protein
MLRCEEMAIFQKERKTARNVREIEFDSAKMTGHTEFSKKSCPL